MRLGMIDEYRIILNPALLGDGTPLFKGGYPKLTVTLRDVRRFKTGAVVLYYEVERVDVSESPTPSVPRVHRQGTSRLALGRESGCRLE
jgi:hypothetical protein